MTPEEQQKMIIQLEQEVLEAAIALYERDRYDDLYELLGDSDRAVDRLLYFKRYGMAREDRERALKEQKEAEHKARIELEVNAIVSRPDFDEPATIEYYIQELKNYQEHGDAVMVEAIEEVFKRQGVKLLQKVTTDWIRLEEGDRNG